MKKSIQIAILIGFISGCANEMAHTPINPNLPLRDGVTSFIENRTDFMTSIGKHPRVEEYGAISQYYYYKGIIFTEEDKSIFNQYIKNKCEQLGGKKSTLAGDWCVTQDERPLFKASLFPSIETHDKSPETSDEKWLYIAKTKFGFIYKPEEDARMQKIRDDIKEEYNKTHRTKEENIAAMLTVEVGDMICHNTDQYLKNSIVSGFLEEKEKNNIKIRLNEHVSRDGFYTVDDVTKGTIIWDKVYEWYPCHTRQPSK